MGNAITTIFRKSQTVLGMNSRNLQFVRASNFKQARHIADNKLLSKKILKRIGIRVPKTYGIITSVAKLNKFDPTDLPKSFVLKPNRGLGGEGILVTYNKKKNGAWLDSDLKELSWTDIKAHVHDILDGEFSLANMPDIAFFEERLVRESMFKSLAYRGVPDIRIIVYNSVPVMAMMRLPTKESKGKANLHLGGIGVGIDIATGITTNAVKRDKLLDSSQNYFGIKIPAWDEILKLAIKCHRVCGLGYMGIDIVLAKNSEPVVLEVNARPGLSIQIANLTGLKERLMRIKGLEVDSIDRGIGLVKTLFGGEGATEPGPNIPLLQVVETVSLFYKGNQDKTKPIKAKIDSGARSSSIDYNLVAEIGYSDVVEYIKQFNLDKLLKEEEAKKLCKKIKQELKLHPDISSVKLIRSATGSTIRVTVRMHFSLKGKKILTDVNLISRENLTYDMIIGRRDLKGFLIKPRRE